MKIVEVNTKELEKHFVEMPIKLYQGDINYIRPLDNDIYSVFDPDKNQSYNNGKCIRWLLQNNESEYIGRIAAFYNSKTLDQYDQRAGGCGFFECINNQEAANLLFEKAKSWISSHGMEAMDGPINFGDRD